MRCILVLFFLFITTETYASACLKYSGDKLQYCDETILKGEVSDIIKMQHEMGCQVIIPGHKKAEACPKSDQRSKCTYQRSYCEDFGDKSTCRSFPSTRFTYNSIDEAYDERTIKYNCDKIQKGTYQKL